MTDREISIDYSVVIPVYNAERTLVPLYEQLVGVFQGLGASFEIVFVEDGGGDGSWAVLRHLAEQDPRISAIRLMRNFGQSNATICGLQHARGKLIITMDDDLQNPPEEVKVLVGAMQKNPEMDAFIGYFEDKKHPWWRKLASSMLNRVMNRLFGMDLALQVTSFRIMRREVVDCILQIRTPHPAVGTLLLSVTPRVANVRVRHQERTAGQGGYTLSKLLSLTLSRFLSFSTFPLRFLAFIGMAGILASILVGSYYLIRFWTGGIGVPGFTTLVILLIALSGFNFFAFGIIGEYLLRILQTVYFTPAFQIKEMVRQEHLDSRDEPKVGDVHAGPVEQSIHRTE